MKQTAIFLCAVLAVGLAGCDRNPPAKAEKPLTAASTSPSAHLVAQMVETRKVEAPFFRGHEAEIARVGDVLTISTGGKPVASLTDNDVYQWLLVGSFTAEGRTYFIVRQIKMETDVTAYNLIIDGEGNPIDWVLDNVLVFDGPMLASGADGTQIDDWTQTPHLVFNFESECVPAKWLNATTIAASCYTEWDDTEGSADSDATITRISPREWRLRETPKSYSAVQAAASSASVEPRAIYDERVTGVPAKPLDSEALKYLTDSGFKRLP